MCALPLTSVAAMDQAAQKASRPAAAKPAESGVDIVIGLVKGDMSEAFVLQTLESDGKKYKLTTADLLKLQAAGVSEAIMHAMIGGGSASASSAVEPAPAAGGGRSANGFPPDLPDVPAVTKRRIAVKPFDYSAVRTWVSHWFNADVNIGEGIRSMLSLKLGPSKYLTVVERAKIDDIMKEQDFSASNRVRKGTGARIGQLSGADVMVLGDIVLFGRDDTTKHKSIGAFLGRLSPMAGAAATLNKEEKAVVGINLRIVDAETGEQIEAAAARGESSRKSKDYGGLLGVSAGVGVSGASSFTSSNFQETFIGEATADAVNKVAEYLETRIPELPARPREIEGRVASVGAGTIVLNVGSNDGVLRGDRFEILKITGETKDPVTKEVIDLETTKVGEFVADKVREATASGAYGGQPLSSSYVMAAGRGYAARLVKK
jgi:curli biogenesis system outer membrane secretion channel CsgG